MKYPWIKNYAGTWQNEEGKTLVIRIQDDENAAVDLLTHGSPMIRPWCGDKPAVGMSAKYDSFEGPDIEVDLGRPGFSLSLNYELDDMIIPAEFESLSIGISMYESDKKAKQFSKLFGNLGRYRRVNVEPAGAIDRE